MIYFIKKKLCVNKDQESTELIKRIKIRFFFYKIANNRKRRNSIQVIKIEDQRIIDRMAIQNNINEYFKKLMGQDGEPVISLKQSIWGESPHLRDLDEDITE